MVACLEAVHTCKAPPIRSSLSGHRDPATPGRRRLIYVKGRSTGKSTIAAGTNNGGEHENGFENGGSCCVDIRMCGVVFAWLVRARRPIAVGQ
jgi:hypothetical protein